MGFRLARVVVALLLLVSATGAAGAASGSVAERDVRQLSAATGVQTLELVYTVERIPDEPGRVEVTFRPDVPSAIERLQVTLNDRQTVTGHTGFHRTEGRTWEWRDGRADPSLTYVANVNRSAGKGYDAVDTAAWTLTSRHRGTVGTKFRYWYRGATVRHVERIVPEGTGIAGANNAFLGDYTVEERSAAGQRFRLVVPDAARMRATPERVLDSLAAAATGLRVGARDEQVTVFVAPRPMRGGGQTSSYSTDVGQDSWVHERALVDTPNNVWIHEYVHTRQAYVPDAEMEWFDEASAEYYAAFLALNAGMSDFGTFRTHVSSPRYADDTLSDRSSWSASAVEYRKGAHVLAALDGEIRAETGGERTLQDVIRRMNAYDGKLTRAAFDDIVAEVVGHRMDAWLARYVDSSAAPRVPDAPARFTLGVSGDSDGDGLSNEREAALATSPFAADTDGDGLDDGREAELGTDPTLADSDDDGLDDGVEAGGATDPLVADTDGDGIRDGPETDAGTDPATADTDGDALGDGDEADAETDPTLADTDGDGLNDGREVDRGTDPLAADSDGDGLSDGPEVDEHGSDPLAVDTDGDGLRDGTEVQRGTDATNADTDGDDIRDDRETELGTDPTVATGKLSYYVSIAAGWIGALLG